jgi:hypothetical protein
MAGRYPLGPFATDLFALRRTPLSANTGRQQMQQNTTRYSITSSASASTVGGIALQRRLLPACPSCLWNCLMQINMPGARFT